MHGPIDDLAGSLLDLIRLLNSPRQDALLLQTADVDLDRALFPLLILIGRWGPLSVAELAEQVGRDPSTISRQLAKLERLGLIARPPGADRRVRAAAITPAGEGAVSAIATARRRLLQVALETWPSADLQTLARLNRRFVDTLTAAAGSVSP